MNICKEKIKWKKYISCLMAMLLVVLSCENTWAHAYVKGPEFTEGILKYEIIDKQNNLVQVSGENIPDDFSDVLEIPAIVNHDGVTYSVTVI